MGGTSSKPADYLSPKQLRDWQYLFDHDVITSKDIKEDWNKNGVLLYFDYGLEIWFKNEQLACARPDGTGFPQFYGAEENETFYDMISKIEDSILKPEHQHRRRTKVRNVS